ncbi:MAG: cyclase family protein, partial [Actinomycetota bacterium]|nr:cyclase family protein [Actinomycetota bacterium]
MRIIDLTHPLRSGMPVYPGDPPVHIAPAVSIADVGVNVMRLELGTHSGTHVDAPRHSFDDGDAIDAVDLARLIGPARIIAVPDLPARTRIRADRIDEQLRGVRPAEIVLFRTGWSQRFDQADYRDHPFLDADVAHRLLDAGVTTMGVDALSPDETPTDDSAPQLAFHEVFLGAGGLIIENLARLDEVTSAAPRFVGLPLPIADGDGSP